MNIETVIKTPKDREPGMPGAGIRIKRTTVARDDEFAKVHGEVIISWVPCAIEEAQGWYITGFAGGAIKRSGNGIFVWPEKNVGYVGPDIVKAFETADACLADIIGRASSIADQIERTVNPQKREKGE